LASGLPANVMDSVFGAGLRVLVVDDNADAATSLATLLSILGYNAVAVFNGQQAIDLVATFRPAVVVSDLHMPIVDGFQLAQILRDIAPDVQLLAWSSDNEAERGSALAQVAMPIACVSPTGWKTFCRLLQAREGQGTVGSA